MDFCYYCTEFHPTAFCLPPAFPPDIVDLFFSCVDGSVELLSPFVDFVMFVLHCGFLLIPESFLFTHLVDPVSSVPLSSAPLPLIWESHRNGYFNFSAYLSRRVPYSFVPPEVLNSFRSFRAVRRHLDNYRRTKKLRLK